MTSSKIAKKPNNRLQRQSLQEILRQLSIASNILLESRASIIFNNILANSTTSIGNPMDGITSDSNGHPMEIVIQSGNKLWRIHPPTQQQLSDLSLSEIDLTNNFLQMLTTSTTSDSSARPDSLEIKDNGIINLAQALSSGDCVDSQKAKEDIKTFKVLRHQDTECNLDNRKVSVKNVSTDCITETQVESVAIEVQVGSMEGIPEYETKDIKKNLELMSMILRSKNVGVYKKDAETLCDIFWKIPDKDDSTTTNSSTFSQTEKHLLTKTYLEKDASVSTVGDFRRYWSRFRRLCRRMFRAIFPQKNFITLELETSEDVVTAKKLIVNDFLALPPQKQIIVPALIPNHKEAKPGQRDMLDAVRQMLILDGHDNQKHLKDIIDELTKQREDIAKISTVCANVMKTQKDHDDANKFKKIQTENSFFQQDKCVSSKSMWSLGRKNQFTNVSVQDICPKCNKKKRNVKEMATIKDEDAVCSLYKRNGKNYYKDKKHHKSERSKSLRGHYEGDNRYKKGYHRVNKEDVVSKVKMLMDPVTSSTVLKEEKELKNIDLRKRSKEKCNCKLESCYSLAKKDAWVETEKTNKLRSKFSFFRRQFSPNL